MNGHGPCRPEEESVKRLSSYKVMLRAWGLGCRVSQEEKKPVAAELKRRLREMEKSRMEKAGVWTGQPCGHRAHGPVAGPAWRRLLRVWSESQLQDGGGWRRC